MAKAVDIASWRAATGQEVFDLYDSRDPSKKKRKSKKAKKPAADLLVVRKNLRPVDVYAYLRARFGTPNGLQNFLRRDNSDNWIHWDFNLKADDVDIIISGTSRDIHFMISEALSDAEWKDLITALKSDFGRIGKAKSDMVRSFEKFVVFQNKFVTLADLCAEMHEAIVGMPATKPVKSSAKNKESVKRYFAAVKRLSKRATDLYGDCLKLRLLTPIMAEAFINMLILTFCKDAVRNDAAAYEAFIRAKIPERLALLSEHCDGFTGPIDQTTPAYGGFKRVMDKRNFAIHGNIEPVREQIETVYFEGKRPLFAEGGDNVLALFDHLEHINAPADVIADYEAVHLFLAELTEYLTDRHRAFFEQVIDDPYPGYEVHKKRVTRILPNQNVRGIMQGTRYDDELKVTW